MYDSIGLRGLMTKPRVAILGLGIMGSGMAGRLLGADFPLTVYNRKSGKAEPFAEKGATVASSPREAAANADVVISIVADDVASKSMWLGEKGALAGAAKGTVLIESSTLSEHWVQELAKAVAHKDCEFLDAPVTGTKPHAAQGQLLFLVGGSASAFETVKPIFAVLGRDAIHLGPTGSGAHLKLINNFLCGVQAASLAEAFSMIRHSGLDQEKALSMLTNGAPASPLIKTIAARAVADDGDTNFVLRLMAKDLGYALDDAKRHGVTLETAKSALEVFKRAISKGYGDEDFSAVIKSQRHDRTKN
jgi:3-hydroxyisobutyrate dehydrogenase